MSDALRAAAASTTVDKSEAVHDVDEWLEALGGASVRIANALNTSHPIKAWDLALHSAPEWGERVPSSDDLLVAHAEVCELGWHFVGGPTVDELVAFTPALIAILAIQRADWTGQRRPSLLARTPSDWFAGGTQPMFELKSRVTVVQSDASDRTYEVTTHTSFEYESD